ncbi:hypothetical protein DFH94DRAFT_784111 [Russula ochroleuca]|jgi:hypothetical protein|uniref:Uncharacterized protein n=1 Tax=Russula ochroleuca TaxID=152965 RepID=A0A9P5JVA8_9AGAM|nr:hypothetical protein DFH94DRAFT_784111 [Russula ochroleuca]
MTFILLTQPHHHQGGKAGPRDNVRTNHTRGTTVPKIQRDSRARYALDTSQYFGGLSFGSALGAALRWPHLMLWKVFALRCMLDVVELLCVDAVVLVGLWLGIGRIVIRITRVFAFPCRGRA